MDDPCPECGGETFPPMALRAGALIGAVYLEGALVERIEPPLRVPRTGMYVLGRNEDDAPVLTCIG